jgi:2-polyprenyl-6-methoxyphenol hydroxylase-like FAD-dependent oxidoreductase
MWEPADVMLVGAGPVGLTLAYELGLAGIRPLVVDRRAGLRPHAPGIALSNGAADAFEQRGLMASMRPHAHANPVAHFSILPLDVTAMSRGHESTVRIPQSTVESILAKHVDEQGTPVFWNHEVVGLSQDDDGVTVHITDEHTERTVRCRYLVGCDGADSSVRGLVGIEAPGDEQPFRGLYGDISINFRELPCSLGTTRYSPVGGIYMCAPIDAGTSRVITAEFGTSPADQVAEPRVDEFYEAVRRLTGTELAMRPNWLRRYGNKTALAARYRADRVFLAGDAAHTCFPLNGQPLHTGIHDAMNLGWKIASVLRGWTSDRILETYEDERRPIAQRVCLNVQAQVQLAYSYDQAGALRQMVTEFIKLSDTNRYLLELVTGIDVRYPPSPGNGDLAEPSSSFLGRRLPLALVNKADPDGRVAGELAAGRGAMLDLSKRTDPFSDIEMWTSRISMISAEPIADVDASAVLLRPDGHVAWASQSPADRRGLQDALTNWFGVPPGKR